MYQKLIIVGNLGRDPELRFLSSGVGVCNLSVATNNVYTKDGEKITETTWFRVSVWGNQGENANKYLKKGSKVLIEGRLQTDDNGNPRTFTRNDGTVGASFEVTGNHVVYLSAKGEVDLSASEASGQAYPGLPDDHPVNMPDLEDVDEVLF